MPRGMLRSHPRSGSPQRKRTPTSPQQHRHARRPSSAARARNSNRPDRNHGGDVVDILVTRRRDARGAKRFFRKLLKGQVGSLWQLVTDKLGSYAAVRRDLGLTAAHRTGRYENNRAEVSHQHSRGRERHMRRLKSARQTQRFLAVHAALGNAFRVARHRLQARHYRLCREQALHAWELATCGS